MTNCSNCSKEIADEEVQRCEECGADGLGNCCIGSCEHDCDSSEDDS